MMYINLPQTKNDVKLYIVIINIQIVWNVNRLA
jgi:hypothetical protein